MIEIVRWLIGVETSISAWLLHHPVPSISLVLATLVLFATVVRLRRRVGRAQAAQPYPWTPPTARHEVWAGYDGEGVYAWSCTCGDGESDFTGEDAATIAGTEHLLDVGAVPA